MAATFIRLASKIVGSGQKITAASCERSPGDFFACYLSLKKDASFPDSWKGAGGPSRGPPEVGRWGDVGSAQDFRDSLGFLSLNCRFFWADGRCETAFRHQLTARYPFVFTGASCIRIGAVLTNLCVVG
ncbi:hypothetical protein AVEN_238558-1 [Araneus ventricosus]|uniref:Uncharacterized protein n=1 Tax=Araneus ventricosus TaxID=182803 RepID=A0A4Y2WV78_ARAVE|nr:hypothetical protein AVEN_238558-1 [Araneus ventricosus]